jgi:hypothetical protein
MTLKITLFVLFCAISITCCTTGTVSIINEKKGTLKGSVKLVNIAEKKFILDSVSAPRPPYMQLYIDSNGKANLTFINTHANSIYFYDYASTVFLNKIAYKKNGIKVIDNLRAYYIRNLDSIYLFDRVKNEIAIANSKGQLFSKFSLINNMNYMDPVWTYLYPQYLPLTVTSMMVTKTSIVFPGQYMFSVPKAIIDTFSFTANISFADNLVTHVHHYPQSLYGFNYNWGRGIFNGVYAELSPKEGEIVYSFPISHDVYIASINKDGYRTVFAGSNEAGTISSFDKGLTTKKKLPDDDLILKICRTDLYTAIRYDRYRKVYYRYLIRAIPDATKKTSMKEKPLVIIVFDENFNYQGETTLGKWENYYWENSFVTEEGLNMEYIDKDNLNEDQLTIKIFALQKK